MSTIDINAGTIHYEATGPENGRPVVFVHGYMMGGNRGARSANDSPVWACGASPPPGRSARIRSHFAPARTGPSPASPASSPSSHRP